MITFGQLNEPVRRGYEQYRPIQPDPRINRYNILGAAFRQENDVVNALEYLRREEFPPDPDFDYAERAKRSTFFLNTPEHFTGITSEAAWNAMETRLAREQADREMLAAGGWGGIAAAMAAGIVSPTVMLPAVNAARAATVGRAALRTSAYTASIMAATEGLLHTTQETRTIGESAFAIGGAAVIGGLLGAAVRYMDPLQMDKLASRMALGEDPETISQLAENSTSAGPRGLSAQATPEELIDYVEPHFTDPGGIAENVFSPIAKRLGVDNVVNASWLGPITRGLASPLATVRAVTAQFGNAGLLTEAGLRGEAAATEGALEQVVKQHYAGFARVNREQKLLFRDYLVDKHGSEIGATLRSMFPGGGFKEFAEEVGEGLFLRMQGRAHDNPQVAKAADAYFEGVFAAEVLQAKHVGLPPFNKLSDEYAHQIVLQKMKPLAIAEDYNAARAIVRENALEQLRTSRLKKEEFEMNLIGRSIADGSADPSILAKTERGAGFTTASGKATVAFASDEELENIAELIADRILEKHLSNFQRHGALDILKQVDEGAAKFVYIDPTRTWDNGRVWSEFLERDAEKLARSFIRSIGADIEIYRRFKLDFRSNDNFTIKEHKDVPFVSDFLDEVKGIREDIEARFTAKEIDAKQKRRELQAIFDQERRFENDLSVLFARLRHTHGMPADPTHIGHRLGRSALQLNTMRLMGSVVISSLPDLARTVLKYGFMSTMRDGVLPMLNDFKSFKMSAQEARHAGEALDVLLHSRLGALAELFDEIEYGTMAERAMQYGTSLTGKVALFDYWNAGLKQFSAAMINAQIGRALDDAAAGTLSARQQRLLGQFNIGPDDAIKMAKLIREGGGSRTASGVWLPNTEDWVNVSDELIQKEALKAWQKAPKKRGKNEQHLPTKKSNPDGTPKNLADFEGVARSSLLKERQRLQRIYRAGLAQGISDTIVTPGLERPNWVDATTMGRLISQFRSFTLSSTFKVALASSQELRQGNMAPVVNGAMFSLALGLVSYYTWATSIGGEVRAQMENELDAALNGDEQAMRRLADEAVTRSGLTGLFAELQKFAERTPGLAPYATFAGTPPKRSPFLNPVQEMFGPTVGLINNLGRIAVTADDPTAETFRKGKQIVPYQNVFWLRRGLDHVNQSLMEAAGAPQ